MPRSTYAVFVLDKDVCLGYLKFMSHLTHALHLPCTNSTIARFVNRSTHSIATILLCLAYANVAVAQDVASFEKRVTKRVLENGLTVLVVERLEAPVFSFFTHVDVGSDREYPGITGLAHMFEHMAFKGTEKIGTKNYAAEKDAIAKVERTYQEYDIERRKETGADEKKVAALAQAWKEAITNAQQYVAENEFGQITSRKAAPA
jgi:hypothetical protein